ncbi:MAG TPA: ATP-dependent zinc metalloprotease FtsH, partial [Chloroflexota bacterium]|nr:ATP-dependent zinc metalloprotease FtsH [Chloroflexota bacterium]
RGLSEVLSAVDRGAIDDTAIHWIQVDDGSRMVILHLVDGSEVGAHYPDYYGGTLVGRLEASGILFETDPPPSPSIWGSLLMTLLPVALIIGFLFWFARRSGMGGAKAFTTAKAELGDVPTTRFSEVVGCDEAVEELAELVTFLHEPERFAAAGARMPRGFLLVGPPGTGKTLLARAVAGEAGVPFYAAAGSDFTEMFVGVGAARVRNLFAKAKKTGGIIFLDELDSIGRARTGTTPGSGGTDERESTLNALLVEMDGFGKDSNVIVIAATNRPDVLDPALLRPGRFDRQVVLPAPDINGRKAILEVHAKGKPFDKTVELATLAKVTPGFSGADLANLINEGAILAARRNKKTIGMPELEEAIDRVIAGPERKSRVMSDREKMLTAYHEGGHAVAMRYLEHHDPVHKVTIIARGMMGGYTRPLPPEDRYYMTKSQFKASIASALGGHAAEHVVFGEISTGAENDIEKATNIARKMVKEYGMSERLGTVALGHKEELVFLGREIGEQKNYSEKTAEAIDEEIRRLIDEGYQKAVEIITDHRDVLDRLAQALIQYETLDGENLERVLRGEPPLQGGAPAETPQPTPTETGQRERPTMQPVPRLSPGAASSTG